MNWLDGTYTIGYFILWVMTLLLYLRRNHRWDGGAYAIALFTGYAFVSIFAIHYSIDIPFRPLRFWPYVYLYVLTMCSLWPEIRHHAHPATPLSSPAADTVLTVCGWIAVISALCLLPAMLLGNGSLTRLITNSAAGQEAYLKQLTQVASTGHSISNLAAVIFNAFSDAAIFCFFYFLSQKRQRLLLLIGLFLCMVLMVLRPVLEGQRSMAVMYILTIGMGYFFFVQRYSTRLRRWVRIGGITFMLLAAIPVIAITTSRFSNVKNGVLGTAVWYVGQGNLYFNNYALDNGGTRHGDRIFSLPKQLLFPSTTPHNFVECRSKYEGQIRLNDHYFTTYIGDLCTDIGPLWAAILLLLFYDAVVRYTRPKDGRVNPSQDVLRYIALCIPVQGGMTLCMYAFTGFLRLTILLLLFVALQTVHIHTLSPSAND